MIFIDKKIQAYLDFAFKKLQQIKSNKKGEVWLAMDKSNQLVIIKQISLTGLPYSILKEKNFAICPKIIHCVESSTETVVVEEFIQGKSLIERLKQKNYLSEQEAKNILIQLCDGLAQLHKCKIIHRDIKPSNLIMQANGSIRLIDFDAARIVKENATEDTKLLGTKGYAPPEQFGYGQTDERSDIYSLGVTIKNLLGKNYNGKLNKILAKCTQIDKNNRYSSVIELKNAVLNIQNSKNRHLKKYFSLAGVLLLILAVFYNINLPQPQIKQTQVIEPIKPQQKEKIVTEKPQKPVEVKKNSFPELPLQNELEKNENFIPAQPSFPAIQEKTVETQKIKPSGRVETTFYVNDEVNQKSEIVTNLEDWNNFFVKLHIMNNSGKIFANSTIKINVEDNFGAKNIDEKSLPTLNIGESTDFIIPLKKYSISGKSNSFAYLQIWINGNDSILDEKYFAIKFIFD